MRLVFAFLPAILTIVATPALAEAVLAGRPSVLRPAQLPASGWAPTTLPPSSFALRVQSSPVTPIDMASSFRLGEVSGSLQGRTRTLLSHLGATQEGQDIRLSLPGDVLFDFDRSEIRVDARAVLSRMAELLRSYPRAPVEIQGHTDWMGDDGYNASLSRNRAEAVRRALVRQGVTAARLRAVGFGEGRPIVPNARPDGSDDPEGRQRNRRVEFVIRPTP